ncbi:Cysteine desulfurase [Dietzia timorensis]|uniref:Cysteine desulfurase n=2 Tax=Dietzia timorensis TaxID=499555 RepID=A0A173LLF1_9ACTN|nr:Cysteine desulfurase [Dietzia timorensis]
MVMSIRHYLDHAATTPPRPSAMAAFAATSTGQNPSSLHADGRAARSALEQARDVVAECLGASPSEVVFTSGGTESDNIGIIGAARAVRAAGKRAVVAVSAAEHHSVLDSAEQIAREGGRVRTIDVDSEGVPSIASIEEIAAGVASTPGEFLVLGAMVANNEIGTITDTAGIARALAGTATHFHADAVQAAGHIPIDFAASGADSMSISGHKFGAPMGIGALLIRRDAPVQPLGFGGGQERDLRSGSVNVPGAVALAAALTDATEEMEHSAKILVELRDRLIDGIRGAVPGAELVGPEDRGAYDRRLPGNVNIFFPGREGESMLMLLDQAGISCSTGSACTAGVAEASHVALATGRNVDDAKSVLRFTLGWTSTDADIDATIAAIADVAEKARRPDVTRSRLRPGR